MDRLANGKLIGRRTKPANDRLAALIAESGVSNKGLARRVVRLGEARGVRGLAYDHTSVLRWLAGQEPREPVPSLLAAVLSDLPERPVSVPLPCAGWSARLRTARKQRAAGQLALRKSPASAISLSRTENWTTS